MSFWEVAGGLGTVGASLASSHAAGEAAKLARRRHKTLYNRQAELLRRGYGSADRLQRDAITELTRGANAGRRELAKRETTAKQEARDLGLQGQAEAESSAASRGLTSTSYLDSAKRAATSDTQRRLADVDAAFGSQFANLAYAESASRAQGYASLASLSTQKYAAEQELEEMNYNFWVGGGGAQHAGSGSTGIDFGGLAAMLAGVFTGNPLLMLGGMGATGGGGGSGSSIGSGGGEY